MKRIIAFSFFVTLIMLTNQIVAQATWEPQMKITGYISTEFNYFDDLKGYENNYGVALSEAGFLTNYKPIKDLTFKSVFVYRPDFSFDQMLNEANIEYTASNQMNLKVGRFLTPLSPMNTYYYAPVNTSATLPVLISNHEFFPLNIDGLSINGSLGEEFKFNYDLFAGGYRNTTWMKTGAVGFFGDEVAYYKTLVNSTYTVDPSYNNTYNIAFGGNAGFSINDWAIIGASIFIPKKEIMPIYIPSMNATIHRESEKITYGMNFRFKYNNTRIIGELWNGDMTIDQDNIDLQGSFIEVSQMINKVTPYARFEAQTTNDIDFNRYTIGASYKPIFEATFKLEYINYQHDAQNINGLVFAFIYSF
ncbi:hypothetical protein [Carboxylicivirga caseinilyticus]|uniref:hypothetical protein n=1 Tax=Carboxylicivirga caseinilyticus TaxID=3417572 RepID=UPI003D332601|nr:hypothetical protein [Marinilabiliaceae bacterium A049]